MVASEVTPFGRLRDREFLGVNNPKPGRDAFRGVRVVSGRTNGRTKTGGIFAPRFVSVSFGCVDVRIAQ